MPVTARLDGRRFLAVKTRDSLPAQDVSKENEPWKYAKLLLMKHICES